MNFIKNNGKINLINKNNYSIEYNDINIDNVILKYLEESFLENIFDFKTINYIYKINKNNAKINIIIPVKGRKENLESVVNNLKETSKDFDVMITVIEYNNTEHMNYCNDKLINYISLDCKLYDFNKSLLVNFAFNLYNKLEINYDFILFHDVDMMVKNNFFHNIFQLNYNNCFIQPYYKKRVLWTEKDIATKIRNKELDINICNEENTPGIVVCHEHFSCGGSIFMKKEMFENIGGLDYYYFDCYGAEDVMLFIKLLVLYNIDFATLESSNIIHLWHKCNEASHKILKTLKHNFFTLLSLNNKKKLMELFKNQLQDCKL